ncbi:hypothetical protein [Pedobacter sp. L105]|uniref:hypothetical protein n=1 Tax=Pedobacter sp. L105 TaxID=1641871 RepID=UPI00131D3CE8|nr:hypothetical protein [Pedobacter sp. L105]
MKRIFLTLAIAAIAFTGSFAQTTGSTKQPTAEQRAEKATAALQKKLTLSADQKSKVYAIELDKFKKAGALHNNSSESKKAKKGEHKEIKKATDAKLEQILTPVQKKKWDAMQEKSKEKKAARKASKKAAAAKQ